MSVVLVGLGYWGPNLLRVLNKLGALAAVFDIDEERLKLFSSLPAYNGVHFGTDWERCLGRNDVDGVVIATPPSTHYEIANTALFTNKNVFIEKPMTENVEEAKRLIKLADEMDKVLMVGHIFLYVPEVLKIKEIIDSGEIGDVVYIHASRLNLGKFQKTNVISDLSPHDISIFNYLLDDNITRVYANGYGFINKDIVDVAKLTFEYSKGVVCDLHLSWLDPRKKRTTTVVGTKKMIVYDMLAEEKIKIYDKGVDVFDTSEHGSYMLAYRHGDIHSPNVEVWEPLQKECEHFLECIESKKLPVSDGENGLAVVKALNASLESLKTGEWVCL